MRYAYSLLLYLKHHALLYIYGTTKIKKKKTNKTNKQKTKKPKNKLTKAFKDRRKSVDLFIHKLFYIRELKMKL